MKRVTLLIKVLYSPWFLAIFPSILILFFLPPLGLSYKLEVENKGTGFSNLVFADLDSDGATETLNAGKGTPYYHILIRDNDLNIFDQWNFKDTLYTENANYFLGDFDSDKYMEIYAFTFKDDSLFLNINEFLDPKGLMSDRLFITTLKIVNNTITSNVYSAGFFDVTGDGFKELYFSIATGFGLEPRKIYYYDLVLNSLKSSQFIGVNCHDPVLTDVDGDNKPELFGQMSASDNYKTPTPFTDKSTWFMVFDEKLNFEFPPVEFPGFTNRLEIESYKTDKFRGYILSHLTASADTSVIKPRIMIFSLSGQLMKERLYSDLGLGQNINYKVIAWKNIDRVFLFEKYILELDSSLKVVNRVKSPFNSDYFTFVEDINMDGIEEFLVYSEIEQKIIVFNESLKKVAEAEINANGFDMMFSNSISKEGIKKIFAGSSTESYFLEIKKNEFYYLGYLAYPGIYLALFLFIILINKINTYQVQQKEQLKQRLLTLQLQGIKSQLDPHFTFNTLNSIASLIYLEDRQSAYDYLNKFTMLLRGMLDDAERVYRSLGEELEFVTTYLELEKMRFNEKFNYTIETGEEVTQREQVPKLVLQTFAENAIKHGLMPCSEGGLLKITVLREGDYLRLTVEDNGIGRKKSAGKSTSTGKGLKLTDEFYEILNQLNKKPIKHFITDLYNEKGNAAGTRVEVLVPIEVSKH